MINSVNTQIKTISLGSQTIRVAIKPGKVGTTPLLLCTGIGASLDLLTPFVEALHASNPDIEVISFDYPGTGCSSTPYLPYRFIGLARTITQMLDYLNVGKVDVLGISWGGFISQTLAYEYPQRVRKLILAATCAGVTAKPPSMKVLSLMTSPKRYTDKEYFKSIAADIYGGRFRTDVKLADKHAARISECKSEFEHSQLGYSYQQLALWGWSSLWFLNQIKQPTLLLGGDDDPLIAVCNMKVLNRMIPDSTLHILEGEGHLFLLTEPKVIPIISEFLN